MHGPTTRDSRETRHQTILALLRSGPVPSQGALRELLAEHGIHANQATLSRDLRELGVLKGPTGYFLPDEEKDNGAGGRAALAHALEEWLLAATPAHNQVVLRTPPGGAQALALALDHARLPSVVGTLAGDDTVLVVCPDPDRAEALARSLTEEGR